jgi:hypothetical protein
MVTLLLSLIDLFFGGFISKRVTLFAPIVPMLIRDSPSPAPEPFQNVRDDVLL